MHVVIHDCVHIHKWENLFIGHDPYPHQTQTNNLKKKRRAQNSQKTEKLINKKPQTN